MLPIANRPKRKSDIFGNAGNFANKFYFNECPELFAQGISLYGVKLRLLFV